MQNTQIIILAAGKGKRMESDEPKALSILQGKSFLERIFDTLSLIDLPIDPVIVVGYKKERIFEVLGDKRIYAHQTEQLGTGHAVLSAKEKVHPDHKIVVVLYSDQPLVSKETIESLVQTVKEKKAVVAIGTIILPDFEDWRAGLNNFGRIIRDKNGQVLKIVEYKDATDEERQIKEVNPSFYAFDASWLWENISKLKNENTQTEYYLTDLVELAQKDGKRVEAVTMSNIMEGFQPNSKQELEILEEILAKENK
ncbi:TPA: hypothetical protein DIC62_01330 [Candidatus Nomurabacteria bacterium]|nr:hypothetical protein [Candidatus Nomurabacteria bacterium]